MSPRRSKAEIKDEVAEALPFYVLERFRWFFNNKGSGKFTLYFDSGEIIATSETEFFEKSIRDQDWYKDWLEGDI